MDVIRHDYPGEELAKLPFLFCDQERVDYGFRDFGAAQPGWTWGAVQKTVHGYEFLACGQGRLGRSGTCPTGQRGVKTPGDEYDCVVGLPVR